jgi:hypothetical protein
VRKRFLRIAEVVSLMIQKKEMQQLLMEVGAVATRTNSSFQERTRPEED